MYPVSKSFSGEVAFILNNDKPLNKLCLQDGAICKEGKLSRLLGKFRNNEEIKINKVKGRINQIIDTVVSKNPDGTINVKKTRENLLKCVRCQDSKKKEVILSVFINNISNLYDPSRDKNEINKINQLKRASFREELIHDPEYLKAKDRKDKLITDKNSSMFEIIEAKTSAKIAKMNCLYRMGEVGNAAKGVSGTALIFEYRKDGTKRLLGVFKPDQSYAPLSVRLGNFVRSFFGQHSLLSTALFSQPTAEHVAYKASKFFNLGDIPSSQLVTVNNVKGVFQLAAQSYVKTKEGEKESTKSIKLAEAGELMQAGHNILNDPNREFKVSEIEAFQRFILHDYLIGNLDAHEENWFVKMDSNNEITQIVGIDKANSFPTKNPGMLGLGGSNQYKWKNIPIANKPFTQDMKKLMKKMTPRKVNQFIKEVQKSNAGFLTPEMIKLLKARAKIINEVGSIKNVTPKDLASIITDSDFKMGARKKLSLK